MSELTDLEICKRIAEIEGAFKVQDDGINVVAIFKVGSGIHMYESACHGFNPLIDDGLCFRLMVKYGVILSPHIGGNGYVSVIENKTMEFAIADIYDDSPNKAICLAIIEVKS